MAEVIDSGRKSRYLSRMTWFHREPPVGPATRGFSYHGVPRAVLMMEARHKRGTYIGMGWQAGLSSVEVQVTWCVPVS
ncbi:MAG: hypothetical protein ACRC75_09100, partial [Olsenella sp.]